MQKIVQRMNDPFWRLIDTQTGGKDYRIINNAGVIEFHRNTGTENTPSWTTILRIGQDGSITTFGGTIDGFSTQALAAVQGIVKMTAGVPSAAVANVDFAAAAHTHPVIDIASVETARILGRATAGTGGAEKLTAAQVRALINVEDGAAADQSAAEILAAVAAVNDSGHLSPVNATALTIATGAVTVTQNYHTVDTEAAAETDDLDTITAGTNIRAGSLLWLRTVADSRNVRLTAAGNIDIPAAFVLDTTRQLVPLLYTGTAWLLAFPTALPGPLNVYGNLEASGEVNALATLPS